MNNIQNEPEDNIDQVETGSKSQVVGYKSNARFMFIATAALIGLLVLGAIIYLSQNSADNNVANQVETENNIKPDETETTIENGSVSEVDEEVVQSVSTENVVESDEAQADQVGTESCSGGTSNISASNEVYLSGNAVVDAKANDIISAAKTCDWDALSNLMGDGFTASFGGDDAIELWQQLEADGVPIMKDLLTVLSTSPAVSSERVVWPWIASEWACGDPIDQQYLNDAESLGFDQDVACGGTGFGSYANYRTGITTDGDWQFFVRGD